MTFQAPIRFTTCAMIWASKPDAHNDYCVSNFNTGLQTCVNGATRRLTLRGLQGRQGPWRDDIDPVAFLHSGAGEILAHGATLSKRTHQVAHFACGDGAADFNDRATTLMA